MTEKTSQPPNRKRKQRTVEDDDMADFIVEDDAPVVTRPRREQRKEVQPLVQCVIDADSDSDFDSKPQTSNKRQRPPSSDDDHEGRTRRTRASSPPLTRGGSTGTLHQYMSEKPRAPRQPTVADVKKWVEEDQKLLKFLAEIHEDHLLCLPPPCKRFRLENSFPDCSTLPISLDVC
eukprot:gnl/Hemi2/11711_TR4024_c0_g1_i1.p1 gnl/Hemi2/11711_TR4024_c0_g1~~gnl/Hemi2/11711_TR4024_c0_g1_i1.p1  ORF type:complete len:176 (-),score=39.20 gnl/Hemi2/11711_TR4024_c0_g1_i1:259-786(-)